MKKIFSLMVIFIMAFTTGVQAADNLVITESWLRVSPKKVAGAFFEIKNNSDQTINVISATAQGSQKVELHTHTLDNGIMRMRKVDLIDIPANGMQSFNPHSYHLMLFRLDEAAFAVGNMVEVELTFDNQTTLKAMFEVKPFGKNMPKTK
uniref:Copper chaperone PCu(A)C n=1 Tax=OCS116 cluster bacterium TaxID=2030921 RepID=A0A2A4Z2R0_9PROT